MSDFGGRAAERVHSSLAALEFEFTVELELAEDDPLLEAVAQRLENASCQDALVGAGATCSVELQFIACAPTAQEALQSAAIAVEQAFRGARITRIIEAPDTPSNASAADRAATGPCSLSGSGARGSGFE